MNLRRAKEILGPYCPGGPVTKESVRAAFAAAVRDSHPDTKPAYSGPPVAPPLAPLRAYAMEELQGARNRWLQDLGEEARTEKVCPVCRGTGVQAIGLKRFSCVRGCEAP